MVTMLPSLMYSLYFEALYGLMLYYMISEILWIQIFVDFVRLPYCWKIIKFIFT